MTMFIGDAAGKVWQFLHENGPTAATRIQKTIDADAALTHQALGWLAREGQLTVERQKRRTRFSLKQ